ncbi:30S ribosomal protein 3-1, chloroplastic, partial [Linum grandiflorum]
AHKCGAPTQTAYQNLPLIQTKTQPSFSSPLNRLRQHRFSFWKKMMATAIQSCATNAASFPSCTLLSQTPNLKRHHQSTSLLTRNINPPCSPNLRFSTFAAPEAVAAIAAAPDVEQNTGSFTEEMNEVAVKQVVGKTRLVLKFIWMEKNIGLGLDQVIPGHGTVPLSPYFFWPRIDAWEELKTTLESKPWISQKKMIILLNQATDIINLWQQSGGNLTG